MPSSWLGWWKRHAVHSLDAHLMLGGGWACCCLPVQHGLQACVWAIENKAEIAKELGVTFCADLRLCSMMPSPGGVSYPLFCAGDTA